MSFRDVKIGCLLAPFLVLTLLWFVGFVLGGITDNWNPVLTKCSIGLRNQYEALKERRLRAKIAYEEKRLVEEEQERQKARETRQKLGLAAEQKAIDERKTKKDARIKEFAEKEAATLWATLQTLLGEIETQDKRIGELRQVLQDFGREPEGDADFKRICEMKESLEKSVVEIRARLEEAYIASKKFEATPGRKDYEEISRKAIEDGVQEADAAIKRFDLMRENK